MRAMKQHPKTSGGGGLSEPLNVAEEINAITGASETSGETSSASDARTFKVESDQNSNNSNENSAAQGASQVAGTVPLPIDGASNSVASIVSDGLVFKVREDNTVELIGAAATPPKGDFSLPANVTSGSTTYEVAALAKDAFAHCSELASISLPATLREVDPDALAGCTSLKSLSISAKSEAFASSDGMLFSKDYSKLLLIPEGKEGAAVIPGKTSSVPTLAFSRCQGIPSLIVGDGGTALSSYNGMLFTKDMKTLIACTPAAGTAVVLPTETEAIGEYAFAGCKDLASITALGNVRTIDSAAFPDEAKTSAVVALPTGENYEARKAVWEAAGFEHFAEPAKPGATARPESGQEAMSGLTYTLLDDYTLAASWEGKDDPAAELEIPASAEINGVPYRVSTIAENAFANRGSLTSVKLPTSITSINTAAFAGCANLATIEFPNTLRTIGERAFEATSIKDVWLPASIETIGSKAFAACESLERVVALGTPEAASDALAGCTNTSIYIPSGSQDSWSPGLPSEGNHLLPYGVSLSQEPLAIEAGQEANLLEGGNLQAPDPVETSYSYAATPLSVDAGQVSAKKAGTSDVAAVLTLDNVELARASRTVEVSPNPDAESGISLASADIPAVYLTGDTQINVTAPMQVFLGDGNGYDVATKPECATGTAIFKNNSSGQAVQLASVSCTTNLGVEKHIQTLDSSRNLNTQRIFSLYPQGNEGAAASFGYGTGVNSAVPTDKAAFGIAPGGSVPYTFRLNLTNDPSLANAEVKQEAASTGTNPVSVSLATVMCTFEGLTFTPTGHGNPNDTFYLWDTSTEQYYSLADVKVHAVDISNKGKGSLYYNMYAAYVAGDSKYVCKSKWSGATYDLCIIDVLHDDKASGGKAGLTFQFDGLLDSPESINSSSTNVGGWGASGLRANMNPDNLPNVGGVNNGSDGNYIWNQVPVDLQNAIEVVKKKYQPTYNGSTSTITISNDKLFIASYSELVESSKWGSNHWTAQEGTQYAYWHQKVTENDGENSSLSEGVDWWERSVSPGSSEDFLNVNSFGDPSLLTYADDSDYVYVRPCFCL